MLQSLKILNFKSLKNVSIDLKNINILSGLNGMGKSSFIQSLLLLRQSYLMGNFNNGLILKGEYIQLGSGKDVFYQGAGEDENLVFELLTDCGLLKWSFDYSPSKHILPNTGKKIDQSHSLHLISLFNNNFQYLSAEHISPLSLHEKSYLDVVENKQVGIHGEFAVHYLVEFGDIEKVVFENLIHPRAKSNSLIHNVDAWLSEISPGIRLKVEDLIGIDQTKLAFEFETTNGFTNEFRPVNVGFGLSHILPILVSILSAKAGKLFLIENPEANIHPRGQSVIGQLLFKAAQNDIQLVIETHSDHILNGIRSATNAIKTGSERVGLFYFERNKETEEHFSIIINPKIDNDGRIDFWPDGFFDEWERNLIQLI